MTGFGLGWVNTAADYSRYLPRKRVDRRRRLVADVRRQPAGADPGRAYGVLLAGSSQSLSAAIGSDPIGALTTILPTWFLLPFAIVAVLGLVSGAVHGHLLLRPDPAHPRPADAALGGGRASTAC